jgi:hypothetical protein
MEGVIDERMLERSRSMEGLASHQDFTFCGMQDVIGMAGERAFAAWSGVPARNEDFPAGDPGWDFEVDGWRIDIKTARKPLNILVNATKPVCSDIVVMYRYLDDKPAEFVAWEFTGEIMKREPRVYPAKGQRLNYVMPAKLCLRTLGELAELLGLG